MLKRVFIVLITIVMLVGLISCDKTPDEADTASDTGDQQDTTQQDDSQKDDASDDSGETKKPVTLKILWATENVWDGFEDFLARYEEETGNKIDIQYYPAVEYNTIINTQMQGDSGPDIFRTDGIKLTEVLWPHEWFYDFSDCDWVSRLTENAKENIEWSNGMIPEAPTQSLGSYGLGYNMDVLQASGVTELPTTFDELMTACEKVKEAGYIPFSLQLASDHEWGATMLFKNNWMALWYLLGDDGVVALQEGISTNQIKFEDVAEFKQSLEQLEQLRDAGYMNEDYLATTMEITCQRLGSGECAFAVSGDWAINLLAEYPDANLGLMPMPLGDDPGGMPISAGIGMSVNAKSENLEAAVEFVEMWCSKEQQEIHMSLNPGVSFFADVEAEGNRFSADLKYWVEQNRAKPGVHSSITVWPEMETRALMQELMLGDIDAAQFLVELDDAAKIIAEGKGLEGW